MRHGACRAKVQGQPLNRSAEPIQRIQGNMLARAERVLLTWLCARLPGWVTPDRLTGLGLVGAVMVFAGYAASGIDLDWLWLAVAGFVVHWFGDSLDGSLARYRRIERPRLGYFIDHSADGIGILMIVGGLGLSPFVRLDVSLLALAGYYLLCIHAFLTAKVIGELRLSYAAAGPTELRLALIALTVAMWAAGRAPPAIAGLSLFDAAIALVAAGMVMIFLVQTIAVGRRIAGQG